MALPQISDQGLVSRAMRNARSRTCVRSKRWAAVAEVFGVGSTMAKQLCREHGLDPDEEIDGIVCVGCNP